MVEKSDAPCEENDRTVSQTEGAQTCTDVQALQVSLKAILVSWSYGHYNG